MCMDLCQEKDIYSFYLMQGDSSPFAFHSQNSEASLDGVKRSLVSS